MNRRRPGTAGAARRAAISLAAATCTAILAGCVTDSVERSEPTVLLDGGAGRGTPASNAPPGTRVGAAAGVRDPDAVGRPRPIPGFEDRGPLGRRVPVFTAAVRAEVQPRGAITFNEQSLPVVSPDGTRMAVPAGLPPEWDSVLAEPGAPAPDGGVMIHDISSTGTEPPTPMTAVRQAVLLGRAVDDAGFLIESPRPDGSRWIGRADWESGAIDWLVTGEPGVVNAFATLGPDGWLAWSRRLPGEDAFSLVLRAPDGTEQELPTRAGSWLMPRFALDGTARLFALVLRGDVLDAVFLDPEAGPAVMATLRRTPLATDGADIGTAYQAMAADVALVTDFPIGPPPPALLFLVHPAYGRAAVWNPQRPLPDLLDRGSFAAVIDATDPRYCLVTTPTDLFRRAITEPRDRIRVIAGVHIPRPTSDPDRAYILLQPSGSLLGVTLLRFEPITDTVGG